MEQYTQEQIKSGEAVRLEFEALRREIGEMGDSLCSGIRKAGLYTFGLAVVAAAVTSIVIALVA